MTRIIIQSNGGQQLEVEQVPFDAGFFPGYWYVRDAGPSSSTEPAVLDQHVAVLVPAASGSATSAALKAAIDAEIAASGGAGGGGYLFQQASPAASWSIAHGFGRLPSVAVFVGGELVEADVTADSSTVHVTFPAPTAGSAILT